MGQKPGPKNSNHRHSHKIPRTPLGFLGQRVARVDTNFSGVSCLFSRGRLCLTLCHLTSPLLKLFERLFPEKVA